MREHDARQTSSHSYSKLIFDVGGHIGQDTDYYLKLGHRVVTVEANPELAQGLSQRFKSYIESGKLSVVNAAISTTKGKGSFFKFENSVFGTISPEWTSRNAHMGGKHTEIQVDYITLQELFSRYGTPYYLKLDIEGADMICVNALKELPRPQFLSVEVEKHDLSAFASDMKAISNLGYGGFQLVQQESVPFTAIPQRSKEGHVISHRFPFGASGLFGMDLPSDRWVSYEELVEIYAPIVRNHAKYGDFGLGRRWLSRQALRVLRLYPGWHDVHCCLSTEELATAG